MNFKAVDLDDDEITIAILDFCSLLDEQGVSIEQAIAAADHLIRAYYAGAYDGDPEPRCIH